MDSLVFIPVQTSHPPRIFILGAGISGLATAWYLSKALPAAKITVFEKSDRVGGLLHTDHTDGFHFEKGPRTFKIGQCPNLLQLALDLGLRERILCSSRNPYDRYLWFEGALQRFPRHALSFLFSPLAKGCISALLSEWRQPVIHEDETVWDFALRRFNRDVALRIFDPMVIGIFGGDVRKISVRACFPQLKAWEEKYGSLTKGFLREGRKSPKMVQGFSSQAIFSFASGIEELAQTLRDKVTAQFLLGQKVETISYKDQEVFVQTESDTFCGDALFCALPLQEASRIFCNHMPEFEALCAQVPTESLAVVSVGYDDAILPVKGFGYLVPTYAKEEILGVVFDSYIFPEHNRQMHETRLTIKIDDRGGEDRLYIDAALDGLKKHLGITTIPKAISLKRVRRALPQYEVGHLEKMTMFTKRFQSTYPHCFLAGNYISGVGVNACIARAQQVVKEWLSK